jgi:glycosyltransferase involved in cell wall biosynthesis
VKKKIAIIITHPIQYYAPIFKLLAKKCQLKVFYTWGQSGIQKKFDPGFGKEIAWDLPMLSGYNYVLLKNIAHNPGSHHYKGIINPNLIKEIKSYSPDALLIYGYAYQSHLKIMRYFKGKIPIWFRGDSTLLDIENSLKSILKYFYLKWVYSNVDKVFYVGTNNKAYFKKYGVKDEQLIFAPHAIDNERFAVDRKAEATAFREKFLLKEKDILILFAGKFEPKKDPEILLNAFIKLHKDILQQHYSLHLLFVGNGILEEKLKEKASFFNKQILEKRIHFIDFQNQSKMPTIYQACDIFCLPSIGPGETWGLAINEAMASEKAILCSDKVGCAKDLVLNSNGLIFKAGNLEDLCLKINQMLDISKVLTASQNQTLSNLTKLGKSSKSIIQDWSFEKQIDILMKEIDIL